MSPENLAYSSKRFTLGKKMAILVAGSLTSIMSYSLWSPSKQIPSNLTSRTSNIKHGTQCFVQMLNHGINLGGLMKKTILALTLGVSNIALAGGGGSVSQKAAFLCKDGSEIRVVGEGTTVLSSSAIAETEDEFWSTGDLSQNPGPQFLFVQQVWNGRSNQKTIVARFTGNLQAQAGAHGTLTYVKSGQMVECIHSFYKFWSADIYFNGQWSRTPMIASPPLDALKSAAHAVF
jgi:hypothetical protein